MGFSLRERIVLRLVNMMKWDIRKGGYYKCPWNDMIATIGQKIMPTEELIGLMEKAVKN